MKTDWTTQDFDDVFHDCSGGNAKVLQSSYESSGPYAVVDQGRDLIAGYVKDSKFLCKTQSPAIIFGDHTRALKFVDFPFCLGADGVKVLRPKIKADAKYLYHYLRSKPVPEAGYSRHFKFLRRSKVKLPPIEEQRRIAAILDQAEALRAKRRQALAKLDTLTQSLFLEMFGDPLRNPRDWPLVSIGSLSVGEPNNGIFRKNDKYGAGLPVVWVDKLFVGDAIDTSECRAIPPCAREVRQYGLKYGDILFCRSSLKLGGLGYNNVYVGENDAALFECHVIRISPDMRRINPIFLNFLLRVESQRSRLFRYAKTVTMSTIDQAGLMKIEVPVPPLAMQSEFAAHMNLRRMLISSFKSQSAQMENIGKSLQHRAFRGEL